MTLRRTHTHRLGLAAAGLFVTLGLTVGLGAAGARADDSDAIAGAPAADGSVDQSRSRYSYQVDPGQQVSDEYLVQNTGTTTQSVTVYATDAFNAEDGSFSLLDGGVETVDVGRWVTFDNGVNKVEVTLDPGAQQIIPFTMSVPADARPGDHAGGIIVSALSPAGEVSVDRRVAIRLYARVKGELQPGLTISSIKPSYRGELNPFAGETSLTISLQNTGNVSLAANTVAQVRGIFGIPLSDLTRTPISEMLPGSSRTVTIVVPGVGPWVYLNPTVSLAATVDEDALPPGLLPTAERSSDMFVVPWAALILVALAGFVLLLMRLGRARDSARAAAWIEYTEAEARRKAGGEAIA
ncbi:WxL protein peptidoglycan domain-containing protein [Cryobacterium sp. W22_MBD10_FK3]|uniref:WxL protein peptidoglycan domain-containing protein n=1 Tax=Cryobacterium sp. W22_MBD10_FK3 TaxID=3240273 RepID=UPI003F928334